MWAGKSLCYSLCSSELTPTGKRDICVSKAHYYEDSVTMRVSTFRRSRFCVHETCSAVRCPFVPYQGHSLQYAGRGRSTIELLQRFLHVGTDYVGFQHRLLMEGKTDMDGITRELGFDN